jgi:hypothetical protein
MVKRKRTKTTQKTEDGATLTPPKKKQTNKQTKINKTTTKNGWIISVLPLNKTGAVVVVIVW